MLKKYFAFVCAIFFFAGFSIQILSAQNVPAGMVDASSELILQISTLPEAKLGFTQKYSFPFLQGDNPLTEGNNINFALSAEISPISLNGIATAVWTPIAFLEFTAGGRIGTGWNMELFGGEIYGIGINRPDNNGNTGIDGNAFDGVLWNAKAGGAFQFDFAALFPGDWNHVVVRTYHEINYAGYTRAKTGESWYFENDDGENVNGFNYYGNYLIGYQMPIFLNMAALLAEADLYLYDTPNRSQWGDDLVRWTFSGILNFAVMERLGITLITQFITQRNFEEKDWQELYYRDRTINGPNPLSLKFYRVAVVLTHKF